MIKGYFFVFCSRTELVRNSKYCRRFLVLNNSVRERDSNFARLRNRFDK